MKSKLILLAISAATLASCSTMYKTGQTPDDVYFSPTRATESYVSTNRDETPSQPSNNYYTTEDRAIRMGISDYRYRNFDNDYGYNYSPYDFSFSYGHGYYNNAYYGNGYGTGFYSPNYSSLYYGNYYYNPYYNVYPVYVLPAGPIKNNTPRMTNLNGYTNNYNNVNTPGRGNVLAPHPTRGVYNNTNGRTSSGLGNVLNRVLVPATSNSNNVSNTQQTNTTRTYTPPPASTTPSSSGSSSSSSSSGRITRPH